jgi:transmembrane sensor
MNKLLGTDVTESRRLVEAVAWRAHLTELGAETSEAFEIWLAADARNGAVWNQVQGPWLFLGEHAVAPELIELRRAALADARKSGRDRWIRPTLVTLRSRFTIAASILIAAFSGVLVWQTHQPDIYRTASGERRVVTLSDGSQIALDSRSEVKVRYSERARDLTLTRGQARFDVSHNVERPFSVIAGGQKVVATGTSFNVDLLGSNLLVTLIEGHVVVLSQAVTSTERKAAEIRDPGTVHSGTEESQSKNTSSGSASLLLPSPREGNHASSPLASRERQGNADARFEQQYGSGRGIELVAGEQLVVSPIRPPSVEQVNVERATAWQNGQLVFENEPLSSVVARVNRYGQRPIHLGDPQTSELRISGVFRAGDVEGFVSAITHYLPVRADQDEKGAIRLSHP